MGKGLQRKLLAKEESLFDQQVETTMIHPLLCISPHGQAEIMLYGGMKRADAIRTAKAKRVFIGSDVPVYARVIMQPEMPLWKAKQYQEMVGWQQLEEVNRIYEEYFFRSKGKRHNRPSREDLACE